MTTRILAWCLAISVGQAAHQTQQSGEQQRPVFRSEANYVEVTAIVTDRRGAVVSGLTREDFELLEDGKSQRIDGFAVIDSELPPDSGPPPYHSDVAASAPTGRTYMVVLDHFHLLPEQMPSVRAALRQFIERHLGPTDFVSVVHLGIPPRASVFTSDRSVLLSLVGVRASSTGPTTQMENAAAESFLPDPGTAAAFRSAFAGAHADAAERSSAALSSVADFFGGLRGRRKALLLFSQGVPIDLLDAAATSSPQGRDAADRANRAMRELIARANRSDVSIYGIDARGLAAIDPYGPGGGPRQAGWDALRILASETGGEAILGYKNFAEPFGRIVRDSSSYYVLGYHSAVDLTKKRNHKLVLRLKNPDLTVRMRRSLAGHGTSKAISFPEWQGSGVDGLLARPLPVNDLGLTLAINASAIGRGPTSIDVQLTVELRGADLVRDLAAKSPTDNEATIGFLVTDTLGKPIARGVEKLVLRPTEFDWGAIATHGLRYLATLTLPPGVHHLRVAAVEERGGRAGSVFLTLEVPDPAAAALALSGVLVTTTAASLMPTVGKVIVDRGIVAQPPTARRDFADSETLVAFVALSSKTATTEDVRVVTMVTTSGGQEVWRSMATLPGDSLASDTLGHVVKVPLLGLSPGAYLMTIEAALSGASASAQSRRVMFRVH